MMVAIIGDSFARQQLHDEIRSTGNGGATVEDFGDVRMLQQRQGLPLGFEAADRLGVIGPKLYDFECDPSLDRFLLPGFEQVLWRIAGKSLPHPLAAALAQAAKKGSVVPFRHNLFPAAAARG